MQAADGPSMAAGIEFARAEGGRFAGTEPMLQFERLTQEMRRTNGAGNRPGRIGWRILEAIYRQEPLLQRGIKKHAGDLVKEGFTITVPGKEDSLPENDAIQSWMRELDLEAIVDEALIYAHVYGTGIIEVEWDDGGNGVEPVQDGAMPLAAYIVDPAYVDFEQRRDANGDMATYLIQRVPGFEAIVLHEDRFHVFRFTKLPGFFHGISTVETAYHTAMSKVKSDQGLGEVMFFAGQAKLHAQIKDAKPGEVEAVSRMMTSPDFTRAIVWDDRLILTQLNPTAVNPQPFYAVFLQSIAAAIGIPSMMLEGAQAGRVTGSETNLADYHSDLRQVQVTVVEPFISRLIEGKTGLTDAEFDLRWNEQPVGKSAEAKSAMDQATAFQLLTASGVMPLAAARICKLDLSEEDLAPTQPGGLRPPGTPGGQPVQPGTPPNQQPPQAPGALPQPTVLTKR